MIVVRKQSCGLLYSREGEFLSTFGKSGNGCGELNSPCGAAFTNDGNVIAVDDRNYRVQLFDSKTGEFLRSFGKEGTGNGKFKSPDSVSVDSDGRIIVCDFGNHHVQVFDKNNRFLFEFADSGDEELSLPYRCVFRNDMFFVIDVNNDCIKVFDHNGNPSTGDGEFGLRASSNKTLIICNNENFGSNCIQMLTLDGRFVGKSVQPIWGCWEVASFPDRVQWWLLGPMKNAFIF